MMCMKSRTTGLPPVSIGSTGDSVGAKSEMRPGGMLVQNRTGSVQNHAPIIRVRVKYGLVYHEINISSQATFGELKKLLHGPTGLHHEDQKLLFKDKERASKAFLDVAGVKDRSKLVLTEDTVSKDKRYLEIRKKAKVEKASKLVSDIRLEVDRLGSKVSDFEIIISRGGKVAEKDMMNLAELLMNQLIKLDEIIAQGDVKSQKEMQVRKVKKYIETLDMLKIKNSTHTTTNNGIEIRTQRYLNRKHPQQSYSTTQVLSSTNQRQESNISVDDFAVKMASRNPLLGSVVVTTQWETFDASPTPKTNMDSSVLRKVEWDLL